MLLNPDERCLICEDDKPAMPGMCHTCGFDPDKDPDDAFLLKIGKRIYEQQQTQAADQAYDAKNSK